MELSEIKPYRRSVAISRDPSYLGALHSGAIEEGYDLGTIVRKLPCLPPDHFKVKEIEIPLGLIYWRGENNKVLNNVISLLTGSNGFDDNGFDDKSVVFYDMFQYVYFNILKIHELTHKKEGQVIRSRWAGSIFSTLFDPEPSDEYTKKMPFTIDDVAQIDEDVLEKLKRLPSHVRDVLLLD